jgi:hypothetical protein
VQAGTDQFTRKDYGFYDSMTTAVLGADTIFIYETIRRFVWRGGGEYANRRLRGALKDGMLASSVTLAKLALYSGRSVRTIRTVLNTLRDLGWVRDLTNPSDGKALVFEIGHVDPSHDEHFFADEDVAALWGRITKVSQDQGWDRPIDVLCTERLGIAEQWYDRPPRRAPFPEPRQNSFATPANLTSDPGKICREPRQGLPPEYRTRIENGIENREYVSPASAGEDTSGGIDQRRSNATGPDQDQDQIDRGDPDPSHENIVQDQVQDDPTNEEGKPEIALDTSVETNGARAERLRRLAVAGSAAAQGAKKASDQRIAEADHKNRRRETNKKNLEGAPPEADTWADLKRLWKIWEELVSESFAAPPSWIAKKGDIVGRKQAEKLLGMYGYERTRLAVTYAVRSWDTIGARFFKTGNSPVLNIGFILRFHEQLFRESELWSRHETVLEEWATFWRDNPKATRAPAELRTRHDVAMKELSSLGLGLAS